MIEIFVGDVSLKVFDWACDTINHYSVLVITALLKAIDIKNVFNWMKLSTPLGNVVQLHVLIKALATLNLIEIWCSCLCMNLKKKNQNEKSDFRKSLLFLSTEVPVLSNTESGGQCSHMCRSRRKRAGKFKLFQFK